MGTHHANELRSQAASTGLAAVQILLDFSGVEAVTASYLKPLFGAFTASSELTPSLYPLVANIASGDVRFELESFLEAHDLAVLEPDLRTPSNPAASLIGSLEPSAQDALEQLGRLGAATAADLHERNPNVASNQTLWNNRLTRLFLLRLAHRIRSGRHWVYTPAYAPLNESKLWESEKRKN